MKVMVLSSGGVDSSTCLGMAVNKYGKENVISLSMFYGQKHDKEIKSARAVANYYEVEHIEMDLTKIFAESDCTLLKKNNSEIPTKSYKEQIEENDGGTVSTYVPFRNGLFLSTAASLALSKKCEIIFYGAHSDDAAHNAYPDCSKKFNDAMNEAIYEGSGKQVRIEAPFVEMTKKDVVKKGLELKVPYELTWSCYEGKDVPCGKCGTCIDRMQAFSLNNVKDPIL
ncbi:7-cyano-7-deazaguanine synthase QueC [Fusobacterium sp. MFO224]|uniref:7-cyano-7-deazaguanine synthase QueC n=1 Tax=Fusobacterium sp. MFO224 TaxID=3378070 RepID=UPI003851ED23